MGVALAAGFAWSQSDSATVVPANPAVPEAAPDSSETVAAESSAAAPIESSSAAEPVVSSSEVPSSSSAAPEPESSSSVAASSSSAEPNSSSTVTDRLLDVTLQRAGPAPYAIFDLQGSLVHRGYGMEVPIKALPAGTYIVKFRRNLTKITVLKK